MHELSCLFGRSNISICVLCVCVQRQFGHQTRIPRTNTIIKKKKVTTLRFRTNESRIQIARPVLMLSNRAQCVLLAIGQADKSKSAHRTKPPKNDRLQSTKQTKNIQVYKNIHARGSKIEPKMPMNRYA